MSMGSSNGRAVLLGCVAAAFSTGAAIAFVDRQAASWSHATFHGAAVFRGLTHLVDPLLPAAALGLATAALAAASGWRPGPVGRTLVACCFATLIAVAIKDQAKFAFGRLWPETWVNDNPSWIKDGAYGFFPFHGGTGWSAFPSGHMCDISAPVAVLWRRLPRWRPLLAIPVALVAVGLFGADFHFVGDLIAGTFLGAACGAGVLAVMRAEGDPAPPPRVPSPAFGTRPRREPLMPVPKP